MSEHSGIIIVGAGACGLMAARELAKAGKKVRVVEARDRVGGRIHTLPIHEWGYPAQAGAEFTHGNAALTHKLVDEVGLTFVPFDMHTAGSFNKDLDEQHESIKSALIALQEDMPLSQFLDRYLGEEKYRGLREQIVRRAEGYDAADASRVSTFAIRDEWLLEDEWQHGRIKEGYGALVDFLAHECWKFGAAIELQRVVTSVTVGKTGVRAQANDEAFDAEQVLVTVPLPLLSTISFDPSIEEKIDAASAIGYGGVVKILLRFESSWWPADAPFFFSDEAIPTWWTQHPERSPTLTGWLAGPAAERLRDRSDGEILAMALQSLANIFTISLANVQARLHAPHVANWTADPYALGAYSYATPETNAARAELKKPIEDTLFFAGEALYSGKDMATVEGALASGIEAAHQMLRI